jgi:peptidoglycan/xylan/chitin deacetylase (PgdA/CDA1 family)
MMDSSTRIVVFTSDLSYSVRRGIVEIDRNVKHLSWLVLVHSGSRTAATLLRNQWRNLRRNGWRWVPYQIADLWRRVAADTRRPVDKAPGGEFSLQRFEARPNVRVLRVPDIHAEPVLRTVTEFAPRLGVSLAAPILRRVLFAIPTRGTVNLHKGKVPDFRGMPPAFWELWTDQMSVGCTVHWVDDDLDTGAIAGHGTIEREKYSSLRGLQLRLDQLGIDLMREVVQALLDGEERSQPQPPGGKTYRKPTLAQIATLKRKMASVEPVNGWAGKRVFKNSVASAAFASWQLGVRVAFAPRVTVLLYHRVSDEARDNLTVGVEQFERQMALIRRHCRPVSIEEVVNWDRVPRSKEPLVCITFDDGYLDNYAHAVPILERYQVPAAFFVATGIVGSNLPFPHDVRRGNRPIPVMQWDHLRAMHARGFTIGSHSVSHIDCAGEREDKVWQELVQSSMDLQRELGLRKEELMFAYPYGGRQHMTPKRLELVKRAGYRSCLSAYGGANVGTVDRFNIMRSGIHWEFSDQALLFACLGLREPGAAC